MAKKRQKKSKRRLAEKIFKFSDIKKYYSR